MFSRWKTAGKMTTKEMKQAKLMKLAEKRASSSAHDHPIKRRQFSVSSKTVKVVVGPPSASVEYTIHEDLLKKHSDFAIAAMNGQWRESDERTIYLMDDEPALFELFADFVYSGEIYYRSGETGPAKVEGGRSDSDIESELSEDEEIRKERVKEELFRRAHSAMECLTLGRCYLLGDKLLSNSFKAAVADAIAKKISSEKEGVPLKLHLLAYNGTSGNNGFKRLVVDIGYCVWDEDNFKDVDCVEYLRDVTMQLRRYQNYPVKRDTLWEEAGCDYHDHGDGETCYLEMF